MNHDLDKMSLPKSSRNQELEVISKRIFEQLFDVERFILKSEIIDNGIDYRCEIKYNGKVTGFCFNFQLKSKEKNEPLKNDTYSKSFEVSNIQYLVNNTHPAFYGFYIVENDSFFYEYLDEFVSNLKRNNPEWESQHNHTLNFSKKLDKQAVDEIYQITLDRGLLYRKINCSLIDRLSLGDLTSNITIDFNYNVTDESEIIINVEKFGFELINQSNWNKVIELHNKTIHSSKFSAKYNMIVGLAYYYTSNYLTSLKYLKDAISDKQSLEIELQNHLIFIISSIKLLLFMITKEEYEKIISTIKPDKHISFHIKIDKAIEDLKEKIFKTENFRVQEFEDCIKSIISNIDASLHVKLRAKSELLIYEGNIAIQEYNRHICRINAFEESLFLNYEYRKKVNDDLQYLFSDIEQQYSLLFEELKASNNHFAFYYLLTYKQKYDFHKYSTFEILKLVKNPIIVDYSDNFEIILNLLDSCLEYFSKIGHLENQLFVKSIKYEVLHYLERYNLATVLINELEESVELIDIKNLKKQFNFIKNGGTNHQMLQKLLDDSINNPKEKIEQLRLELIHIDKNEEYKNLDKDDYFQVNLFPIGDFFVPKNNLEEFYKIFDIKKDKLKEQFKFMFDLGVIPVVNTCNPKEKIEQLRLELIHIDKNEEYKNLDKDDYFQVNLFPIGDFFVPKNNLEEFYKIFDIKKDKLKEQFKFMFDLGVIPVVNTYVFPIKQEGFLQGNLEYKGFENYLNMFNARKKFFENKFYKVKNK